MEYNYLKDLKEDHLRNIPVKFGNKRTMMVLYRSPEHICNLYGLSRAGY